MFPNVEGRPAAIDACAKPWAILTTTRTSADIADRFCSYPDVDRVLARGPTRSSVTLKSGLQVDLRVVPAECYGAALHYFIGSKAHNIAIRRRAQERGLLINEYGVFRGDDRIAGETEESVFAAVGLPFIAPELRENAGEIEIAAEGRLPRLVEMAKHQDAAGIAEDSRPCASRNAHRSMSWCCPGDSNVRVPRGLPRRSIWGRQM